MYTILCLPSEKLEVIMIFRTLLQRKTRIVIMIFGIDVGVSVMIVLDTQADGFQAGHSAN